MAGVTQRGAVPVALCTTEGSVRPSTETSPAKEEEVTDAAGLLKNPKRQTELFIREEIRKKSIKESQMYSGNGRSGEMTWRTDRRRGPKVLEWQPHIVKRSVGGPRRGVQMTSSKSQGADPRGVRSKNVVFGTPLVDMMIMMIMIIADV
ncbi:jg13139 [Pararge aegeria aegeria]|uniref:Jg13139 protein n=1 Tax=Pararge aegeria aegeria TaxID=348720 RepID=A0A8S4RTL5_9NEOP|nr:jg13139 [Pararge aegeria aegeria]